MELTDRQVAITLTVATVAFIGAIVFGQVMADRDIKTQAAVERALHLAACRADGSAAVIVRTEHGDRATCSSGRLALQGQP